MVRSAKAINSLSQNLWVKKIQHINIVIFYFCRFSDIRNLYAIFDFGQLFWPKIEIWKFSRYAIFDFGQLFRAKMALISSLNFHKKSNLFPVCRFQCQVPPRKRNTRSHVYLTHSRDTRTIRYWFSQNKAKRGTTLNAYNSLNIGPIRL